MLYLFIFLKVSFCCCSFFGSSGIFWLLNFQMCYFHLSLFSFTWCCFLKGQWGAGGKKRGNRTWSQIIWFPFLKESHPPLQRRKSLLSKICTFFLIPDLWLLLFFFFPNKHNEIKTDVRTSQKIGFLLYCRGWG